MKVVAIAVVTRSTRPRESNRVMTSPPDDILDLLTAYALGAIAPDEIARVSALLDEQPELRATLAELRATADMLPYGLPQANPPADLRQRVPDHATARSTPAAI